MIARLTGAIVGAVLGAGVVLLGVIAWGTASYSASTLGGGMKLYTHTITFDTAVGAVGGAVLGFFIVGAFLGDLARDIRLTRLATEQQLQRLHERTGAVERTADSGATASPST
jgi:hypothetical protein